MSTILLPTPRRESHNLFRHVSAGIVAARSGTWSSGTACEFGEADGVGANGDDICRIQLANVGLVAGDLISARGQVAYDASAGQQVRLRLTFLDAAGGGIANHEGTDVATPTGFVEQNIANIPVPVNATQVILYARVSGGTGVIQIRRGMINRGPIAAAHEWPRRGAIAPLSQVAFGMEGEQAAQRTTAGVAQITSFPSRLWQLAFTTIPLPVTSDEFREWELAQNLLSDLANVFRFVPPDYRGPSTAYIGATPLVQGGSQLGTSLVCDGVDASTAIAKAGDYASFDVTSPRGNTNAQLFKLAAAATSNGSGVVTLTFTKPIRQAPADNAVVQIFSPTAQFAFTRPLHKTASDSQDFAQFPVESIEQVYP
jgi:hypothetical protein